MNINKKEIAAYALLPQVFPRFRDLFTKGFGWIAYIIANIYYSVRLLPQGHPYLLKENQGKYGIRNVITAAALNLRWGWKYIDQIAIFMTIMIGIILLAAQIILVIFGFLFSQAHAGLFQTLNPESDNAFMLLDYVFGIPGFFGSCALGTDDPANATIAPCIAGSIPVFGAAPVFAYHAGLHSLLEFYSWSLLFVAILIFLYFVVVITAETAATGVPFGARFNTAWGPIRLLVAIGLLIPVAYGLNSAQYLTLAAAKLGSGLATNAWLGYNDTVAASYGTLGMSDPNPSGLAASPDSTPGTTGNEFLLPRPQLPDTSAFFAGMMVIRGCEYAYMKQYGFINRTSTVGAVTFERIRPWLIKPGAAPIPLTTPDNDDYTTVASGGVSGGADPYDEYDAALEYFDYGDVTITFGARPPEEPASPSYDPNNVFNYCGQITVPTTTPAPILTPGNEAAGAWYIQKRFFQMVLEEWMNEQNGAHAARYNESEVTGSGPLYRPCYISDLQLNYGATFDPMPVLNYPNNVLYGIDPQCHLPPNTDQRSQAFLQKEIIVREDVIDIGFFRLLTVPDLFELTADVRQRGWAAAGMWYNKIAEVIGREFDAASNIPYLASFPYTMSEVRKLRGEENTNPEAVEQYNPKGITDDTPARRTLGVKDTDISWTLYNIYKDWHSVGVGVSDISTLGDQNVLTVVMHGIFGTRRLMSLREEEYFEVHPMSQLVAVGKDLVNSTLINVLASTGLAVAGGIYRASGAEASAGLVNAFSGAFSTIALVGLTAGFLLFYVLPFMPFLYFFFAVGTWIKTIFEAMVGVPLWALAHIRIDREGLPGDAAANGYFLLLEIFLRPILIVFSLIASFIIFGALVRVLHEIFDMVIDNTMGFDQSQLGVARGVFTLADAENKRGIIDEFFFTIIYVFTVYMIGLSCFKLIDQIPDGILRWVGAGVKSFGDTYEDPAQGLTQYAAVGGYLVGSQAMSGIGKLGSGAGQAMGRGGARLPTIFPDELEYMNRRNTGRNRSGTGSGTGNDT